jgi:hypothetical protein
MKKTLLILSVCIFLGTAQLAGQATPGTVNFSVTTLTNNTDYSPKHVLAIWVEDNDGNFVKTLKIRADKRKQYLYTWNDRSSGSTTDAVTGSTLSSHTTHSIAWDCTNTSGTIVNDGTYKVYIEYTSEHAQGPITSVDLTKSETDFNAQPSDAAYFTNMDVEFTAESATGMADFEAFHSFSVYPVPARDRLNVSLETQRNMHVNIKVYSLEMKLIEEIWSGEVSKGDQLFSLDLRAGQYVQGPYVIVVEGDRFISARRFIVE